MAIEDLPDGYKLIDLMGEDTSFGKIAASAQPGGRISNSSYNFELLDKINNSFPINELASNSTLVRNLDALYDEDIRYIYNLIILPSATGMPELSKQIWEKKYLDCEYITEVNDIEVGIEDFHAPTQQQLAVVIDDIIKKIKLKKNCLIHCLGGLGRTGTILAALYMKIKNEHNADNAIQYIRDNYRSSAIETKEQEEILREFAKNF